MKTACYICMLLLNFSILFVHGQVPQRNSNLIEDAIENAAEQINEGGEFEIPDEVSGLLSGQLDINTDNLEILIRYNLINATYLSKLEEYKNKMGHLIELEELQQVEGFSKSTIQKILPFVTIRKSIKSQDSHHFTMRIQKKLNNTEEHFPGSTEKILLKYKGSVLSSLSFSFTGEKDAGEEMLTKNKPGFDFNSFNLCYKDHGLIKKIIAGDYNIEFGQGVTAWTGFGFGNGSSVTGIYKYGRGIIPYSGTDENRFLRGIALSLQKNKLRTDVWISYHKIDGNVVVDSITLEAFATSLQTSGYHRTLSENLDRHSLKELFTGTSLTYFSKHLITGVVITSQGFNLPILPENNPYSTYKFRGQRNFNAGWNYSISLKNFIFFGENVFNSTNSFALLNGVLTSLDSRTSLGFLTRTYSKKFPSLKSNAFGVNGINNNESGNYIGLHYKVLRTLNYSSYIDVYSFPYLKYRVDKPSYGYDHFHQLEFNPVKKFSSTFKYRSKMKQLNGENSFIGLTKLKNLTYENIRISIRFKPDNTWEYSMRVEVLSEFSNGIKSGKGTMVSQGIFYHPIGKAISMNIRYAIFNCPEFNTRIYEYENDVQGAFSIPFYYGTGSRFYTNITFKLNRTFTASMRYSISWLDESTQTISDSEIKFQLKAVFRQDHRKSRHF